MIKLVLFDFDMTLVDSSHAIHYCTNEFARYKGLREVAYEETLATIGFAIEKSWRTLWGDFNPEWLREYREKFSQDEYLRMRLFPDTIATLKALREKGVKIGIASNRRFARRPLKHIGLDGLLDSVIGLEDVKNPKPAPDVLEKSLEFFGIPREDAIYAGDTDIDIQTAQNAKLRGVGVATGAFSPEELRADGAWKVCGSLSDILKLVKENG